MKSYETARLSGGLTERRRGRMSAQAEACGSGHVVAARANESAHGTPVRTDEPSPTIVPQRWGTPRGALVRLALVVGMTGLICGCPGAGGAVDPPSDAPEFAGRWQLRGEGGRDTGCLEADETGDPLSLTGNPEVTRAVDEDEIFFDGLPRATASGLIYTAIARTSVINEDVLVVFDIEVFQLGLNVGTQHFELDGVLTDEDHVVGTFESRQEAVFADVPPVLTEDGTAERGGCP